MHSRRAIGFATAVLIVGACSDATGTSGTQPVVIDGLRGQHEWDDATSVQAFSGATFLYKTVDENLYLALEVSDATLTDADAFLVRFDNTRNGTFDENEDQLSVTGTGAYVDAHSSQGFWGFPDEQSDGAAAAGAPGGTNFFEIVHPLMSTDAQDFSLANGDVVGYCIVHFKDGTASGLTTYPRDCQLAGSNLSGYAPLNVK